jgi:hypothetical protein
MLKTISNPIFLAQNCRWINNKLLWFLIIGCCSFHFHCVISKSKFSQAEAAKYLKAVNFIKKMFMPFSVKSNNWASKKIELNSEFYHRRPINLWKKFVSQKYIFWILKKVFDWYKSTLSYFGKSLHWSFSCFIPIHIIFWDKYWVFQ